MNATPLLDVVGLSVAYVDGGGLVSVVDDVSFSLGQGQFLGVAGESGCGKSTLAGALLRGLRPPAVITAGRVLFRGHDVLRFSEERLRAWRWSEASMVLQSAMDCLNPVLTIKAQLADAIAAHAARMTRRQLDERLVVLMELVGLPERILSCHPHMLSGGMRQRVNVALALALAPSLVIMDEPTTALDVVVQRELLTRLMRLQKRMGFALIAVSHDLPLLLSVADTIAVLYAGRIVEIGPSRSLREEPRHPYTRGLMSAFPELHTPTRQLRGIAGAPPTLRRPPPGCRFHPRCSLRLPRCACRQPALTRGQDRHQVACHLLAP